MLINDKQNFTSEGTHGPYFTKLLEKKNLPTPMPCDSAINRKPRNGGAPEYDRFSVTAKER